jgi:hypothetical protein
VFYIFTELNSFTYKLRHDSPSAIVFLWKPRGRHCFYWQANGAALSHIQAYIRQDRDQTCQFYHETAIDGQGLSKGPQGLCEMQNEEGQGKP